MTCLCGSGLLKPDCCEKFLNHKSTPPTPEALMRSRYVAFCLKKMDYLRDSTHPETRSHFDLVANRQWAESVVFTRLEIVRSWVKDLTGYVEFKAFFLNQGQVQLHHEKSTFLKTDGIWYFYSGETPSTDY